MIILRKGFTFLELAVVLFISALFLTFVFPRLEAFTREDINTQAARVYDLLTYADNAGILGGHTTFTVDLDEKSFILRDAEKERKFFANGLYRICLSTKCVTQGKIDITVPPMGLSEKITFFISDANRQVVVEFNPLIQRVFIKSL